MQPTPAWRRSASGRPSSCWPGRSRPSRPCRPPAASCWQGHPARRGPPLSALPPPRRRPARTRPRTLARCRRVRHGGPRQAPRVPVPPCGRNRSSPRCTARPMWHRRPRARPRRSHPAHAGPMRRASDTASRPRPPSGPGAATQGHGRHLRQTAGQPTDRRHRKAGSPPATSRRATRTTEQHPVSRAGGMPAAGIRTGARPAGSSRPDGTRAAMAGARRGTATPGAASEAPAAGRVTGTLAAR